MIQRRDDASFALEPTGRDYRPVRAALSDNEEQHTRGFPNISHIRPALRVGRGRRQRRHRILATGDLDIWVDATAENARCVVRALAAFGAPMQDITERDFARPGVTYQIGVPPGRIDILTELTGITFEDAWRHRVYRPFGEIEVDFIGRDAFIRNKRATGRTKDLADIEDLEQP